MHPISLGVGVVWWPPLDALCRPGEGLVDVVELEPEAFWSPAGGGFRSVLPAAVAHLPQPKLLHGVGAPLGGTVAAPPGHAAALAGDIAALAPAHVSEHLSLTRFRPRRGVAAVSAGFMLPPLQSRAGIALAVANIARHRRALGGIGLAVETPVSYLPPIPGEWPDGAYVATVATEADCGIVLDLHNALCNARNGRQSLAAFCEALPPERVWEVHLAGGEALDGFFLDAHAGLVEAELLEFAASLLPRLPCLRAVILEILPERAAAAGLHAIGRQLGAIRDLWDRRAAAPPPVPAAAPIHPGREPPLRPDAWERLLGRAITGLPCPDIAGPAAAWWRAAEPALELYRKMVGEGRASAVAGAAPSTTRLLLRTRGGADTRRILAAFWRETPPAYTAADEARAFLRYLADTHAAMPGLPDAARADAALLAE